MILAPGLLLAFAIASATRIEFIGVQPQFAAVGQRMALVFGEGQTTYVRKASLVARMMCRCDYWDRVVVGWCHPWRSRCHWL